jgi:hypothetical protein
MFGGLWMLSRLHGSVNIGRIMRTPIPLSDRAIRDAKVYTGNADATDAIESLVDSYGSLVADLRRLRSRVREFDAESAELDALVESLRAIARSIDSL